MDQRFKNQSGGHRSSQAAIRPARVPVYPVAGGFRALILAAGLTGDAFNTVADVALLIALGARASVFSLVLVAWLALGASLGPVLLVPVANQPLPTWLALVRMGTGVDGVFAWGAGPWAVGLTIRGQVPSLDQVRAQLGSRFRLVVRYPGRQTGFKP